MTNYQVRFLSDGHFVTRTIPAHNWLHAMTRLHEWWPSDVVAILSVRVGNYYYYSRTRTTLQFYQQFVVEDD